jgi:hypothetical protein
MVEAMEMAKKRNATEETAKRDEFTCEVCFEVRNNRLLLNELKTGNGDVLRKADCGHHICCECMTLYVATKIQEQRVFNLRCPHEGCKNELYEQDVLKLPLDKSLHKQFAKLRSQDYSQRAKDLKLELSQSLDGADIARIMLDCVRLCPRCHVILQRSAGCNSFYCICGHHFRYDKAPRLFPPHYFKIVRMSEDFNLTFEEAETRVGQGFLKARRLALQMGVPLEEALELQRRAQDGDESVRHRIREARRKS